MLRNYLKTAVRSLAKRWGFTAINTLGLAVGLAVALLALLFVRQQWQMDRFHPGSEDIYRVTTVHPDEGMHYATAPRPLPSALQETATGIEAVAPVRRDGATFVVKDEKSLSVEAIRTSAAFWEIFSGFRLRAGNEDEALSRPRTAVVSAEMARQLFGSADPVGQTFRHEGETEYTVVGVLSPPTGLTSVEADVYLSIEGERPQRSNPDAWERTYLQLTYVRLSDNASPSGLQATVDKLLEQNIRPEETGNVELLVQSLGEMRFSASLSNEISGLLMLPGWIYWLMGALAIVVLLAAGFNYVNLAVARSIRRAREVGVRKTLGAQQRQLVAQFLGEAILTSILASVGAVVLLSLLVPVFNDLYFMELMQLPPLQLDALLNPGVVALVGGIAVVVGLLAGAYPAFVLSTYRPVETLSGQGPSTTGGNAPWLRGALITGQVAFTLILVVTATTMLRQTWSMAAGDHDLRTDQVAAVNLQDVSYDRFRSVVGDLPSVKEVSAINNLMLGPSNYSSAALRSDRGDKPVEAVLYAVDTSYVRDLGLPLRAALENWDQRFASSEGLILNTAGIHALGFNSPRAALGVQITRGDPSQSTETLTVVGVVENFDFTGTGDIYGNMGRAPNDPVMLYSNPRRYNYALVRATSTDLAGLRGDLEEVWTERLDTVYPIEVRFYDDILQMRYGPLGDLASMVGGVALLAILIAVLGLLSLAAYHVETHVKEIGIRKALGASVTDVVARLSRPFAVLVAGASLAAAPVAWIVNRWWLQLMSDTVDVRLGFLLLCVGGLVGIAMLTIGTQTIRAALIDPATTLRDE